MSGMSPVDIVVLAVSAIMLPLFAYTGRKNRLDRGEGIVMLVLFFAYYTYLIAKI